MAELIARMASDELAGVLIKTQHNCVSNSRSYAQLALPRIEHEYLVLFKKRAKPLLVLLGQIAREQQARLTGTWKTVVRSVLMSLGGKSPLAKVYELIAAQAPEKLSNNQHWREKVRQTLNSNPRLFASDERGVWALA